MAGKLLKTISSGHFTDVCYHAGCVYAAPYGDPAIYVYNHNTGDRIRTIDACKSNSNHFNHTLRVTSCGITLACCYNDCIHLLDHICTLHQTHGKRGNGEGEFMGPRLCSVENNGSMLVADEHNYRFQVFNEGEWRVLPLPPNILWPRGAVVTQQALYVVRSGDNKLIMYEVK